MGPNSLRLGGGERYRLDDALDVDAEPCKSKKGRRRVLLGAKAALPRRRWGPSVLQRALGLWRPLKRVVWRMPAIGMEDKGRLLLRLKDV